MEVEITKFSLLNSFIYTSSLSILCLKEYELGNIWSLISTRDFYKTLHRVQFSTYLLFAPTEVGSNDVVARLWMLLSSLVWMDYDALNSSRDKPGNCSQFLRTAVAKSTPSWTLSQWGAFLQSFVKSLNYLILCTRQSLRESRSRVLVTTPTSNQRLWCGRIRFTNETCCSSISCIDLLQPLSGSPTAINARFKILIPLFQSRSAFELDASSLGCADFVNIDSTTQDFDELFHSSPSLLVFHS